MYIHIMLNYIRLYEKIIKNIKKVLAFILDSVYYITVTVCG
jgi:hypothetical protein